MPVDAISLEVFKNLFISVAEEMGVTLGRTAYSPNIKERRDFSCALFDEQGRMVAQAAHIPVHLGSMPASVEAALASFRFSPGDVVILNDPYLGGTHLPDITLVAPVFVEEQGRQVLAGFVANRGHHADIGGMTPGSLPLSTELYQEGFIIPPLKLVNAGQLNQEVVELLCRNSRTPVERRGDLSAQLAAIRTGERRLEEIVARYGLGLAREHMVALMDYSERLMRATIASVPAGTYAFRDTMDGDGLSDEPVALAVSISVAGDEATVDFTGTSPERSGCINTPIAVAYSAVLYTFLCLAQETAIPPNHGCARPLHVVAPPGCLLNPSPPHAVAGGNVETSQRVVDVLFGALAKALPHRVPAASQGTMNNLLVGGHHPEHHVPYVYYETIAGGMGGRPTKDGLDAVQTHMTNTMNTPVEAVEYQFPLRILRYAVRGGSGGAGRFRGGNGVVREMEFLAPSRVTVISERRRFQPYGLQGGGPGQVGENLLLRQGIEEVRLGAKATVDVQPGDVLRISTPGGGGWGMAHTH
ncbi:MAG: hydantoinase B/oxoprolinase family protein [Chloroflexi bacterium]|nr:hydantoinase B/oxoprolinase family protein [Chloroflexota bacterium]